MATLFTIQGTTAQGTLARDAICANYGYQATIDEEGTPNPESEADFAKRMVTNFITENVKKYRVDQFNLDRATAITDAETEVDGVATV